jgi:hypothetical protein
MAPVGAIYRLLVLRGIIKEDSMSQRKAWKDLSPWQRVSIFVGISIQISLLVSALVDIRRRPAEQIRGPKLLWAMASFINFVGPVSYFAFGRKPAPQQLPPA